MRPVIPQPDRNERPSSLLEFRDREVYGRGHMGYRFRARIEQRVWKGRDEWRFVGEYYFVGWADEGPGLPGGKRSRWSRSRPKVIAKANKWLDSKELKRESVAGYA